MNVIPIIKSKLVMPQLPQSLVVSDRLQQLGIEISRHQVVLISAPAGYGKTTLTTYSLNECRKTDNEIRWYRLDHEDNDQTTFYSHLLEMLFPPHDDFSQEAHEHFDKCGENFSEYQCLNALLCQELWASHSLYPDSATYMVFDDFHEVMESPQIVDAIHFFIENVPPNYKILICSRAEIPLLSVKRRLEEDILEIQPDQLCLTEQELGHLITLKTGIAPDSVLLNKIMRQSEGWVASIILICQLLDKAGRHSFDMILDRPERKELLFQYIVQEIIQTIDHQLLMFLVKAAILKDFTVEQAAAVLNEPNPEQLISECEQKELFLQKLYNQDVTYRFHSLFRDALLYIQAEHLTEAEIKEYHLKAAGFYIENHRYDRAIEHFIQCGDVATAVELVTRESAHLIALQAVAQLRVWLGLLPAEAVMNNGILLFFKSFVDLQSDPDKALLDLKQAIAIFEQSGEFILQVAALTAIGNIFVQRSLAEEQVESTRQSIKLLESVDDQSCMLGCQVFKIALAFLKDKYREVIQILDLIKGHELIYEWRWTAIFYGVLSHCFLGDLKPAHSLGRELIGLDLGQNSDLLGPYGLLTYSLALQLQDEYDLEISRELSAVSEKTNYHYIRGYVNRFESLVAYRKHNLDTAISLLDDGTSNFERVGNIALTSLNILTRCLWLCPVENPAECLAEAKQAIKQLMNRPSGWCYQEIGLSYFGAIAREAGEFKLAEKHLKMALRRSKRKGAKQVLAGVYMHLAQLYFTRGDDIPGQEHLQSALDLAENNHYVMFWDIHFPTLIELAARSIRLGIHPQYSRALITRYYDLEAADFLCEKAALTANEDITELAAVFTDTYHNRNNSQAPRIVVNLFGSFSISIDGMLIPAGEWKTKKISGILKYLIMHRGRAVFREHLSDVFWPEVDRNLAQASLRAALYELKKVLRKYGAQDDAGISFFSEKRDRLQVHTGSLLSVDVDTFLACYSDLNQVGDKNLPRQRALLEKMAAIYRGDLLENDAYEDWLFAPREELKSIYLKTITELADIYETDGLGEKAEKLLLKVLTDDPYNEAACLQLLKLYVANNQRARAAKMYSAFSERFTKDLGIIPDKKLFAIVKG